MDIGITSEFSAFTLHSRYRAQSRSVMGSEFPITIDLKTEEKGHLIRLHVKTESVCNEIDKSDMQYEKDDE
jgi:hypothetical protein